ncbi:uncharacterized protein LOC124887179 [Capsicum annuum]|uniref:uncharacterized protein LOC124887179 n=1 Tax=Capsicum annuum TaxID=4072 RepID=UPI001FB18710|nr:uncharacterized protein LOC124887179 [Capsicum annuum]
MLDSLPTVVTEELNNDIIKVPTKEKVKFVVMGLNRDSAGGFDGMNGAFYQDAWEIIVDDLHRIVIAFLMGMNFQVSEERARFVHGRSIAENILVVQEIVAEIRKRGTPPNMIMKLDMIKAYDRPKGFFKSSRGLKQGDPLSPTLFIIAAEVLSRSLKELLKQKNFKLFGMPRGSPKLNHLAFVDDMIIMCKAELGTLKLVTNTLEEYEKVSGQRINKDKSALYLHEKTSNGAVVLAEEITGILRKEFPLNYLDCPIFYKRKKKLYYQQITNRISTKL